jgi:hypothetical protein
MIRIRTAGLAAALLAGAAPMALAQDSNQAHHPDGATAQAAAPAAGPNAASGPHGGMAPGGMPGSGMMGPGMMGGANMMAMMEMMHRMAAVTMAGMTLPGMDMADRVEGRIAFLRAELKITDVQAPAWDAFAQALRDNAKQLHDTRGKLMGPEAANAQTPVQRLEQQEQWYAARLDGMRAIKTPLAQLYATLSDEQKKMADQILPPHLGMVPMGTMGMMAMTGGMPMHAPETAGGNH